MVGSQGPNFIGDMSGSISQSVMIEWENVTYCF